MHKKTEGGTVLSPAWAGNDGLVNTVSARCPFTDPSKDTRLGGTVIPGFWNVLPVREWDHLEAQGGTNPFLRAKVRRFYRELMEMIGKEA